MLNRRDFVAASGAALAVGCAGGARPPSGGMTPLKDTAAANGFRYGAILNARTTLDDPVYRRTVTRHCNLAVAENHHKWTVIRPDEATFDFGPGDRLVDFAEANGLPFRFHTLYWADPSQDPDWLKAHDFGARPAAEAERLMRGHVARAAARYRDRMDSWDVVNEAVHQDTGAYRSSPLSRAMGGMAGVLDTMFHAAREALPDAQLVYNDYMDWRSKTAHRDGVLRALEGMVSRGVPVDALGLQSHLWGGDADGYDQNPVEWRAFLDEVEGMGLGVLVTELDVDDRDAPADLALRDRRIADVTRAYLDTTFETRAVRDVVTWGLTHDHTWLAYVKPRADGQQNRGLPFGASGAPTPMAFAIQDAMRAAPARA